MRSEGYAALILNEEQMTEPSIITAIAKLLPAPKKVTTFLRNKLEEHYNSPDDSKKKAYDKWMNGLFAGTTLSLLPAPAIPTGFPANLMAVQYGRPRYALDEQGRLIGLNLAALGLEDDQWKAVAELLEREGVRLRALNVRENNIKEFVSPPNVNALEVLDVAQNQLKNLPPEVVKRGSEAVLGFLKELQAQGTEQLLEAKMLIIGEGGSGKTTLYRKLAGNSEMPKEKDTTRGIDIHLYPFRAETFGRDFILHIWDFGGQEIYHATHQFFLTKRSLYILLTDNRREEKLDYWLQAQKLYGDKSPLIVVQNEKDGRKKELPLNEMRDNFPNLRPETYSLDLKLEKDADKERFKTLKTRIESEIMAQPHVGDTLPRQWLAIRQAVKDLANQRSYISQSEYFQLCAGHGLPEEERALRLSEYLHDLGVFLHFQDDVLLAQTLFLDNSWVTDAVFALIDALNNESVTNPLPKWQFNEQVARQIWCAEKFGSKYKEKIAELIALIEKFELCYKTAPKTYLVPQLLPGTRPEEEAAKVFRREGAMQIHFKYGFMPKGLLSRLMVRMHRYISNQKLIWNSGMILHHPTYQTDAEIVETYLDRDLLVWVKGGRRKEFATTIIDEINLLNATYGKNLVVTTLLPCICATCRNSDQPHFYDYTKLRERKERGKPTIECAVSYDDVNVQRIIENVFVVPKAEGALRVFISYSKADEAHKNTLLTYLKPLMRQEDLIHWDDSQLMPGEEWDARIRQEITAADIVLVLLSADALATDYIWDYEIKQAVEQSKSGRSAVIPIILRPCDWPSSPLARLSALPRKGAPVASFSHDAEAWQQVTEGLREVVQRIKGWR